VTALLLSWNVAGRVRDRQEAQIAALAERPFDVLCLQEVTPTSRARWVAALEQRGLHVAVSALPAEPRPGERHARDRRRAGGNPVAVGPRRFAVLIAAREPLRDAGSLELPWPERHLRATTALGGADVEVHTLHAPLSSKEGRVKVHTLEAVFAALSAPDGMPRVLAGDLNTPRYESREGEIVTFARDRRGRMRPELGERRDRAELLLIDELVRRGWRDAFRSLHGYSRRDRSWALPTGFGYRLDHILVSPGLEPLECEYVHDWRTGGLSDHAAMWARIAPGAHKDAGPGGTAEGAR
jgi:endonuclease/exonuclease/phosphatase family metal-dependent hydrolase